MNSRRRLATVLPMLASIWLFAGCADTQALSTPQPPTQAASPAVTVNRSNAPTDTLRWSIEGVADIASLDPALAGDSATVSVINFVFGGLVRLNEALEVVPNDAESWETSADGTTYTFKLRAGLRFANGDQVTASDYVYSINRAIQPATGSFGAPAQLASIVGAEAVIAGKAATATGISALDSRTLKISLATPFAAFLQQLTFPYTFVVPRSLVESGQPWRERPFGTGPYLVKEWQRGDGVVLAANPVYWQGKSGIPNIHVRFSGDSATAYKRYLAGDFDIMGGLQNPLPSVYLPDVRDLPDFRTSPALNTRYIGFNNRLKPFDNEDVRRAFAQAVDREQIARDVLGNEVVPAMRILPPGMVGTQLEIKPLAFDVDAAQAALARAGFAGGRGMPAITLAYAPEGENELVVKALQSAWTQNLGITVALRSMDTNTFSDALNQTWLQPESGLQIYYSVWGADYPDPQNFLSLQLLSTSRNNNGHFSDALFDQIVTEADRISARPQIQRRLLLYNQAEQIAIDRVGWLPILHTKVHLLIQPRVQGIVVTPNGLVTPDWSKARLAG